MIFAFIEKRSNSEYPMVRRNYRKTSMQLSKPEYKPERIHKCDDQSQFQSSSFELSLPVSQGAGCRLLETSLDVTRFKPLRVIPKLKSTNNSFPGLNNTSGC